MFRIRDWKRRMSDAPRLTSRRTQATLGRLKDAASRALHLKGSSTAARSAPRRQVASQQDAVAAQPAPAPRAARDELRAAAYGARRREYEPAHVSAREASPDARRLARHKSAASLTHRKL